MHGEALTWQCEPAANFYRVTKGWQWLEPVIRDSLQRGGDSDLLMPAQSAVAEERKWKVVEHAESSGSLLCLP